MCLAQVLPDLVTPCTSLVAPLEGVCWCVATTSHYLCWHLCVWCCRPPELIKDGLLTKAADVYAFGVIIWELYVGRRAWEGLKPAEVLRRVAAHEMLDFPLQTPHRLKVLGERCMASDPATRPSFSEVLSEVNAILADTMSILQKFLQSANNAR